MVRHLVDVYTISTIYTHIYMILQNRAFYSSCYFFIIWLKISQIMKTQLKLSLRI